MARIELRGIAHRYGEHQALHPLELTLEHGGAYALLGPSGCGKTTLLNILSGLLRPSQGQVLFNGQEMTAARPQERNIAQVFQFPVLYDTMSVFDNLAFPLRNRGVPAAQVRSRVQEVAELLELKEDLDKRARGLPAEAQQRIALGRGLVRKDVAALLLDEPLTVIDPHLKWLLRRKLKQVHEQLQVTLVYVTHDQVEALTLADQVLVMQGGRVLQQGTPQELFERPQHTFVGYFIGSPGMNLLPCTVDSCAAVVAGQRIPLDPAVCERARSSSPGELVLGIRPELVRRTGAEAPAAIRVELVKVEERGHHRLATARLGSHTLQVRLPEEEPPRPGEPCWLEFPPQWLLLYADGRLVS